MYMQNQKIAYLITVVALILAAACGAPPSENNRDIAPSIAHSKKANTASSEGFSLTLANASNYLVHIAGCASGYVGDLSSSSPNANLYKGDRNCRGRLTTFTYRGTDFTPDPNFNFHTDLIGDTAVFLSGDLLTIMDVTVLSQLSSPILAADHIDYEFHERPVASALGGSALGLKLGVTGKARKVPTSVAPNLGYFSSLLIGEVAAIQTFNYKLSFQCNTLMVSGKCGTQALTNISYLLVKDTYGGTPCVDGNVTACADMYRNNNVKIQSVDVIAPGTGGMPNGGFTTKTIGAKVLVAPNNVASNPEMLFVLSNNGSAGTAFTFFNLDVIVTNKMYLNELALVGLME